MKKLLLILLLVLMVSCKPCREELVLQKMKPVMKTALAFANIADSLKKENDSLKAIIHGSSLRIDSNVFYDNKLPFKFEHEIETDSTIQWLIHIDSIYSTPI